MQNDAEIETLLAQRTRFRRLSHVASCPSTQDLAAVAPHDGDAVFWADHQTQGRGRQQREWRDEPGADLAVTFRVRCALPQPLALPAALPVAVLQAIEPVLARPLRIKWPNDLFLDGKKLCGVLIDAGTLGPDSYLVGIGINCNSVRFSHELDGIATSIAAATGRLCDRGGLLLALATRLEAMLQDLAQRRHEALLTTFRDRLGLVGKPVEVDVGTVAQGTLAAIDFQQLALADGRSWPLAITRAIRPT
jgi:BirA family transcriptional regulator, biotin operon repressor / biotin---[acetyl-CoA-carboxylase] ligase